jgi:PAS domain-containing protein
MPLRLRIAAIIFLIGSGISVLTTWQAVSTSLDASRPQITRNESYLLEILQKVSTDAALTGEFVELTPYMERLQRDPDILRAMLADRDGRIIIATDPTLVGKPLPPRVDTDSSYWRVRDIQAANERLGLLAVEFSTVAVKRLEQASYIDGATIVAIGVVLSLVLALLGSYTAVGRLVALTRVSRDIANGNTLVSPVIPGNDEIADLSNSIQIMVSRIEQTESERLSLSSGSDQAEQYLRALSEATSDPVIIKDGEGKWDEANAAARRLLRLEGLPWRGKSDADLAALVPPLATFFRDAPTIDHEVLDSQRPAVDPVIVPDPVGEEHHLDITRIPFFDAGGKPTGLMLVAHDLTGERSIREQGLAEHARLQTLLANVSDAVVIMDAQGSVETINEETHRLTGWTNDEIKGRPVSEALPLLDY